MIGVFILSGLSQRKFLTQRRKGKLMFICLVNGKEFIFSIDF